MNIYDTFMPFGLASAMLNELGIMAAVCLEVVLKLHLGFLDSGSGQFAINHWSGCQET